MADATGPNVTTDKTPQDLRDSGSGTGAAQRLVASEDVAKIIAEVRNPLQFYALALLVTEAAMGAVVARQSLTGQETLAAFGIMSGLFLAVVVIVTVMAIVWPGHLYDKVIKQLITLSTSSLSAPPVDNRQRPDK